MEVFNALRKSHYGPWLGWALVAFCYFFPLLQLDYHHDEGFYAEQAVRVLRGELPNIDFATNYIGGFTYYNALWMLIFGKSFWAMRRGMLFLLLFFVPTVYALSRKLMPPVWAAIATLLVMTINISMAPTVSANWYSAFFVAFAFWVLLQTLESKKFRGAFIASGALLGIAFLLKQTTGLYGGFACFLVLLLHTLNKPDESLQPTHGWKAGLSLGRILLLLGLIPAYLISILRYHWTAFNALAYFVPLAGACVVLALLTIYQRHCRSFRPVLSQTGWLILGGLFPVLCYLLPFIISGHISTLMEVILSKWPQIYLTQWYQAYENHLRWQIFLLIVWILALFWSFREKPRLAWVLLSVGLLALYEEVMQDSLQWVNAGVYTLVQVPLWLLAAGCGAFLQQVSKLFHFGSSLSQPVFRVLAFWILGACLFLINYPFTIFAYIIYSTFPLVILATYGVYRLFCQSPSRLQKGCLVLLLLYWIPFGALFGFGQIGITDLPTDRLFPHKAFRHFLDSPRGGLWLTDLWFDTFTPVMLFVAQYSVRDDDVFLWSDGPEFYFLTDHRNPTRYSHAYLSAFSDGSDIVADLQAHQVRYIMTDVTPEGTEKRPRFAQPPVLDYVKQHFQRREDLQVPGFQVFERTD